MAEIADTQDEAPRALKLILHTDRAPGDWLQDPVSNWQLDGIAWIAVVGKHCAACEEMIRALIRASNPDRKRFIMITSHPDETLEAVSDFMLSLVDDYEGDVAIMEF